MEQAKENAADDFDALPFKDKVKWAETVAPTPPPPQPSTLVDPEFEKLHPRGPGGMFVETTDKWEKTGKQKGSNPGGTYKDENGVSWYVKTPPTDDHVRQDVLANRLYADAGLAVPLEKGVLLGTTPAIASKIVSDFTTLADLPDRATGRSNTKDQDGVRY
jgi:hypothetical protein